MRAGICLHNIAMAEGKEPARHARNLPCPGFADRKGDSEAMRAGLLDLKQAQEWVVTTKLGASDKRPGTQARLSSQGAGYRELMSMHMAKLARHWT